MSRSARSGHSRSARLVGTCATRGKRRPVRTRGPRMRLPDPRTTDAATGPAVAWTGTSATLRAPSGSGHTVRNHSARQQQPPAELSSTAWYQPIRYGDAPRLEHEREPPLCTETPSSIWLVGGAPNRIFCCSLFLANSRRSLAAWNCIAWSRALWDWSAADLCGYRQETRCYDRAGHGAVVIGLQQRQV